MVFASSIISLMFWPGIEPGNTLAQRGIKPRFSLFNYDRITQRFDHSAAEPDESSGPNLNWYPKPQNLCHHGIPWNISVVVVLPNRQVKMIHEHVTRVKALGYSVIVKEGEPRFDAPLCQSVTRFDPWPKHQWNYGRGKNHSTVIPTPIEHIFVYLLWFLKCCREDKKNYITFFNILTFFSSFFKPPTFCLC